MIQTMRNERLAVRQKLIDVYDDQLRQPINTMNQTIWKPFSDTVSVIASDTNSLRIPGSLNSWPAPVSSIAESVVLYDSSGTPVYPIIPDRNEPMENFSELFERAGESEFMHDQPLEAIKIYTEIIAKSRDDYTLRLATIGQIRCYRTLGNLGRAESLCRNLAYDEKNPPTTPESVRLTAEARVLLIELAQDKTAALRDLHAAAIQTDPLNPIYLAMDSSTRIFLLTKATELAQSVSPSSPEIAEWIIRAENLIRIESLAQRAVQALSSARDWTSQAGRWFAIPDGDNLYGFCHSNNIRTILILSSRSRLEGILDREIPWSDSSDLNRMFVDPSTQIGNRTSEGNRLLSIPLGDFFPDWVVEVYLMDGGLFDKAAQRQVTVYLWGGILVIVVILLAGAMAIQGVGRQIRLNRLKNDFVATVTHELKTPLSSMRMLVDTLLEGRYRDQQQVREYLELISRENQRLSRMIENFLTFSRMERNKYAFSAKPCDARTIVSAAVEVVDNRFEHAGVRFSQSIEDAPGSIHIDSDAMVTVLVNLLDNAFKYSGDIKEISLRVFSEPTWIFFEVKDNGRGMTRKVMRRIFDRFYQADPHLNRTAEGCGLGLSIVEYIVKAHDGRVDVDSTPGKGSTFTVRIPNKQTAKQV